MAISTRAQVINFDVPGGSSSGIGGLNGTYLNYSGQGGLSDTGHNYWNPVVRNGTTSTGYWSDGTNFSGITLTCNANGGYSGKPQGANGTPAALENFMFYANNSRTSTNALNNVPAGTYDLYLYGKNADADRGTLFTVWTDSMAPQSQSTTNTSQVATFIEHDDYVVFTNINLDANGKIYFNYTAATPLPGRPGGNTEGDFNGLQLRTVSLKAVPKAPVIKTQPISQIVREGRVATFSAEIDSGGLFNNCQWTFNGNAISGATTATLTLTNVLATQAGTYRLFVTNSLGNTASDNVTLTVDTTTTTSLFTGGDPGEGLDLSGNIVQAQYFGGWDYGSVVVQNATFSHGTLGININGGAVAPNFGATANDTGVANIANDDEEADAAAFPGSTPNVAFNISTTPGQAYKLQLLFHDTAASLAGRLMTVKIGSEVIESALDPSALGAYGQRPVGVVISYFFTGSSTPLQIQLDGVYSVNGSAYINAYSLEALPAAPQAPYFVSKPADQNNVPFGDTATFTALAGGAPGSVQYQWYFAGAPISGATNKTYTFLAANAGLYTIVLSNSVTTVSASANLTLDPNLGVITGTDPSQGLDLSGNIVLAEYYGDTTISTQTISGVTFYHSSRAGGNVSYGTVPNFGTSADQAALALISSHNVWGSITSGVGVLDFSVPTTPGMQYQLMLILHDFGKSVVGQRVFTVTADSTVISSNLDLVARGAYGANPKDIALYYTFTASSSSLHLNLASSADAPLVNALVLKNLSVTIKPPVLLIPLKDIAASVGDTVVMDASAVTGESLTFQWQKLVGGNYVNVTAPNASGASNAVLTLSNVQLGDAGSYKLHVSNLAGTLDCPINLLVYPSLKGMVGHWISGDQSLADTSGFTTPGTHDGTVVGTGTMNWSTDVPTHFTGFSLDLTSDNVAISINNSATNDPGYQPTFDTAISKNMSIALWAKGTPNGTWRPFVSKRGENGVGYQVRRNGQTNAVFTIRGTSSGNADPSSSFLIEPTSWHHYAATWDGVAGIRRLYVDNKLVGEITGDFGPMATALPDHLVLGGRDQGGYGNYFPGLLYDVRIYGVALTQDQITAINKLPPPIPMMTASPVVNGHLTITWNSGVLQSTTELKGSNTVWVTEATTGPLNVNLSQTAGNKFYRVVAGQ